MYRKVYGFFPWLILTALAFSPIQARGQTFSLSGQASGWVSLNDNKPSTPRFGLRYLPSLSFRSSLSGSHTLDVEVSVNAFASGSAPGWTDLDTEGRIKAYRAWIRYSSNQFEARLGLQKINFGSASMLRPLMWFDRIDPRDPLQITDGVTGLLLRYYFLNNANIWIWGLTGNNKAKGWEISPAKKNTLEMGGRVQLPVPAGELGLTTHHRTVDLSRGLPEFQGLADPFAPESRYALDGKWDVGIGLWVEASLIRQKHRALLSSFRRALTVGADYTFAVGSGLYAMAEHFIYQTSDKPLSKGEGIEFTALSAGYSLGLLDRISAIVYYDWANRQTYNFISLQRTTDNWQFYIMGFWNPAVFRIYQQTGGNFFTGKGFQIMVVYNH
jgi:hypothetical protein